MTLELRTKSVRDPVAAADGQRLLITRYWPRGLTRDAVAAEWDRRLSPSAELLRAFKKRETTWAEFARRFRQELKQAAAAAALVELRARLARGRGTLTLLCECRVPAGGGEAEVQCHRRLVAAAALAGD